MMPRVRLFLAAASRRRRIQEGILAERTGALEASRRTIAQLEAFNDAVSHDLKAPLRHLEGFVGLLLKHLDAGHAALDDQGRHYLDRITSATKAMGTILEALAAYARLSAPGPSAVAVDLDRLIASLMVEFPAGPVWEVGALGKVRGNPSQLRLAFRQLLANAVKFSSPKAEPRVWVRRAAGRGGRSVLEVGDNGVGFDPAFMDQLFGPFHRLHPREAFEGIGMGLAMVARVAKNHGGEVWAQALEGEGARFFLSLETVGEGLP